MGLSRVRSLLAAVGDPQLAFRSILVGGTNGKGSTARALAECLQAAGETVGLYTSPHLSRIGERFVVAGRESSRTEVAAALESLRPEADRLNASFFEVLTVAACLLFRDQRIDTAVMEVGLGGRLDATNALEPRLSIITGISLDHVELLGSDPASIAAEKAGIMRPARLTLTGANGTALVALRERAEERGVPLWVLGDEIDLQVEDRGWQGASLLVNCPSGRVAAESVLVGRHQQRNLALAAAAALASSVTPPAVARGLSSVRWPGRLERVAYRGRWLVFDGAHNAEAAATLASALARLAAPPYTLVAGMGRDKDLPAFAAALGPGAARVFATAARHSPRARHAQEVAKAFGPGAQAIDDPSRALEAGLAATEEEGLVLVAGSLYLVGELRPSVLGEAFEPDERWQ